MCCRNETLIHFQPQIIANFVVVSMMQRIRGSLVALGWQARCRTKYLLIYYSHFFLGIRRIWNSEPIKRLKPWPISQSNMTPTFKELDLELKSELSPGFNSKPAMWKDE